MSQCDVRGRILAQPSIRACHGPVMMKLKGTQHPKSATAVLNALCQMPVFYGKEVHLTVAMMNLLEKQWVELVPRHGDPAPEPQQETKAEGGNPSNEVDTELFTWDLEPAPFVSEAFRTVYVSSHPLCWWVRIPVVSRNCCRSPCISRKQIPMQ